MRVNPRILVRPLRELVEVPLAYGANARACSFARDLPRYVRITDIDEQGFLKEDTAKSIPEAEAGGVEVAEGDVLFARSGATVGKTYLHEAKDGRFSFAGYLIRARPNRKLLVPGFLREFTRSRGYWRWIKEMQRAGAQPNISASEYGNLPIPLPSLEEQNAIVALLRSFSSAGQVLSQLLLRKQELRRALMLELLIGERRFPEYVIHSTSRGTEVGVLPCDWEVADLGAVVEGVTRRVGSEDVPVLTCSGRLGLIDHRRYFSKRVASESRERYYLLQRGEFAYNRSTMKGYPFGAVKRLEDLDAGALSTLNICFRVIPSRWNDRYASHLFESGILNAQLGRLTQVGARAHGLLNISKSDFLRLRVPVPTLEEQKRIADCLDLLDQEIALTGGVRDAYELQRQAVTEKLLSGEVEAPVLAGPDS